MANFNNNYSKNIPINQTMNDLGEEIEITRIKTEKKSISVHCLSDLHADTLRNQQWVSDNCKVNEIDTNNYNIMIVPGDIGTELESLDRIFSILSTNYDAVCYCIGNHEAWRRGCAAGGSPSAPESRGPYTDRMAPDSISKIIEILKCAKNNDIHVGPLHVSNIDEEYGVWTIPLQSWYHSGWDKEPKLNNKKFLEVQSVVPFERRWGDFAQCTWPGIVDQDEFCSISKDSLKLANAFGDLNKPFLDNIHEYIHEKDSVLSFSHFVPRQECCPEKRFLLEPNLAYVIGSDILEEQIRILKPQLHCFGHTHIPIDVEVDDIRYIQWPLGYHRESDKQCTPIFSSGPLKVFDTTLGTGKEAIPKALASLNVHWTKYYIHNARDPSNQQLAPWVETRLDSYSGFVASNKKREQKLNQKSKN